MRRGVRRHVRALGAFRRWLFCAAAVAGCAAAAVAALSACVAIWTVRPVPGPLSAVLASCALRLEVSLRVSFQHTSAAPHAADCFSSRRSCRQAVRGSDTEFAFSSLNLPLAPLQHTSAAPHAADRFFSKRSVGQAVRGSEAVRSVISARLCCELMRRQRPGTSPDGCAERCLADPVWTTRLVSPVWVFACGGACQLDRPLAAVLR